MTKRVESLRAPCLDASSTLATSTKNSILRDAFFVEASRSFSWWRLGRVVCAVVVLLRRPIAAQSTSIAPIAKIQINLSLAIISILATSLPASAQTPPPACSALDCGSRSTLGVG